MYKYKKSPVFTSDAAELNEIFFLEFTCFRLLAFKCDNTQFFFSYTRFSLQRYNHIIINVGYVRCDAILLSLSAVSITRFKCANLCTI